MKKFSYLAKDADGKVKSGAIKAETRSAAEDAITTEKLTPISIKEVSENNLISTLLDQFTFVPAAEKVMFSKQLATLVSAGVPISQAMHILEEQLENKKLKKTASAIAKEIEGGASLSSALEKQGKIFSSLYTSMVKAGEVGGMLDKTLESLAEEIEKEHDLVAKIRGAMTYPIVILVMMVVVVLYMLATIIPKLAGIYGEMGAKLPASTRFLLGLSSAIRSYGIFILIAIIAAVYEIRKLIQKNDTVRFYWHSALLRIPVFGKLARKINIARFTRNLGSLLGAGASMPEALKVSGETLQNEVYKKEVATASEKVQNGAALSDPIKKSKNFPVIVPQMISVGEETGTLDKILLKITDFYEKEIDNTTKNLSSLIEPLMMILIGAGVGFIVISVISPIYQMSNLF